METQEEEREQSFFLKPGLWISCRVDLLALMLVLVLSVPALLWFGRNWRVPSDGAWYLLQAWSLVSGEGLTVLGVPQTVRGPVFPGFLGLAMSFFGRDVGDLAWASRLLALANPVLTYFLVKRISGRACGLVAAALVALLGYTATLDHAFNVDAAMLTPYLLAIVVLLRAVQKGGVAPSLLSGVLLGVAILTKETAFVALPLALLAALLLGWTLRGVLLHYLGLVLVCAPWWAWVWSVSGEVYLVGEVPARLVVLAAGAGLVALGLLTVAYRRGVLHGLLGGERSRRWAAWSVLLVWVLAVSFFLLASSTRLAEFDYSHAGRYIAGPLVRHTPGWYLLPLALLYVLWRVLRRDRRWEFYLALLALQIPASVFVLVERYSTRQWLILQTLLYGALAGLTVGVVRAAFRRRGVGAWPVAAVAVALVVGLLLPLPAQLQKLTGEYGHAEASVYNQTNPYVYEMQRWISGNVPEGESVITTWNYSNQLAFLDGSKHEWVLLEEDCERGILGLGRVGCLLTREILEAPPQPAVWFAADKNCGARALSVPTLLRQMEEQDSGYLLVTPEPDYPDNVASLVPYLVESGAFEIAYEAYLPKRPVRSQTSAVRKTDNLPVGLVLLRRTGVEDPEPQPTRMSADTYRQIARCDKAGEVWRSFARRRDALEAHFPNGIRIVGDGPDAALIQGKVNGLYRR